MLFFGLDAYPDLVIKDTFPVGCQFSDKNIYPETFSSNADSQNKELMSECGIYKPHCGLDNVMFSWGHDEVGRLPGRLNVA